MKIILSRTGCINGQVKSVAIGIGQVQSVDIGHDQVTGDDLAAGSVVSQSLPMAPSPAG